MKCNRMIVELEFITPVLGTKTANKEVWANWVETKAKALYLIEKGLVKKCNANADAVAKAEAEGVFKDWKPVSGKVDPEINPDEKGVTVFFKTEDDRYYLEGYMLKGQFKAAGETLAACTDSVACRKAGSKAGIITKFTELVFVTNDIILKCDKSDIDFCERPLCAKVMGQKVTSISRSQMAPAGTKTEPVEIVYLNDGSAKNTVNIHDCIIECLEYGQLKGLGQWRNSRKGSFKYTILKEEEGLDFTEVMKNATATKL